MNTFGAAAIGLLWINPGGIYRADSSNSNFFALKERARCRFHLYFWDLERRKVCR